MAKKQGRVLPSAALKKAYYRKLMKLIDAMDASVKWWLEAEYKKQESKIINSQLNGAEPRLGGVNSLRRRGAWEGEPAKGSLTNNGWLEAEYKKQESKIVAADLGRSEARHARAERTPYSKGGFGEGADAELPHELGWWLEAEYKKQESKIINSQLSGAEPRLGGVNSLRRRGAWERVRPMWSNAKGSLTNVAFDSAPTDINDTLKDLFRRWRKKFDDAAADIGKWFVEENAKHSNRSLQSLLIEAGFTVKLKLTKAQRTKLQALVLENVNLIKSIPQKYFTELTTVTLESVSRGRDLAKAWNLKNLDVILQ